MMPDQLESRWTPPSAWCPHPEHWHATSDPDSAEIEVTLFVRSLVRMLQPDVVIETGTAAGDTAEEIGRALEDNGHGQLWTVEIDRGLADKARKRLDGLPVRVECADSLAWIPPEPIDFAWIDSGTAEHRCEEIREWHSRFSSGAVIGVHDTAPNMGREALHYGLKNLLGHLGWPALFFRTPRGVTLIQVP